MLGAWVKAERERRGWSQSELARRAGIKPQAISLLESDKRQPRRETVEALAHAFELADADHLYRAAYGISSQEVNDPEAQATWEHLPGWQKRLALRLLEASLQVQREITQGQIDDMERTQPQI